MFIERYHSLFVNPCWRYARLGDHVYHNKILEISCMLFSKYHVTSKCNWKFIYLVHLAFTIHHSPWMGESFTGKLNFWDVVSTCINDNDIPALSNSHTTIQNSFDTCLNLSIEKSNNRPSIWLSNVLSIVDHSMIYQNHSATMLCNVIICEEP